MYQDIFLRNPLILLKEENINMNILVVNCGSSSLKFQLIDMTVENVLARGNIERIGEQGSFLKYQPGEGNKVTIEEQIKDHSQALNLAIKTLLDPKIGVIKDLKGISAIGHRVVHGGEFFSNSVIIDEKVIDAVKQCIDMAPLHNPPNLMGIEACKKLMPNILNVGVFDTAFHQTMPKQAYIYSIPYEMYEKYKIRRYGFHGISHQYVFTRAMEILGTSSDNIKVVTCHLGSGASVCAIKDGESLITSMGFTPLEGLQMGTRSGTIDPSVVTYIMEKENLSIDDMTNLLNKRSGALGLSGVGNDFRDIERELAKGDERAQLAVDVFSYRVKKYIASYAGIMGGIDVLVFTAGVGEWSSLVRKKVIEGLEFMGIEIDNEKNKIVGQEIDITKEGAKVKTIVIPTNEELMIARETKRLVSTS